MVAAFVDFRVTLNNVSIRVSCSECFNLSLPVLKAAIVQSTQTGQCVFKPERV